MIANTGYLWTPQVEFDTFMSHSSAAEVGTTRASIIRTSKMYAAKGVSNHYNEYEEFHQHEVEAHISASFMEMSGMEKIDAKSVVQY